MKYQSNKAASISHKGEMPGNQQERLKTFGWITGFVDGEGSFSVSIYRNKKARMRLNWQVFPEFVVTQGEKSLKSLKKLQKEFGCGKIYKAGYKKNDNHREPLYRYCVRSVNDLSEKIIPFFGKNRLYTAKKDDFEKFFKIIKIIQKDEHLKIKGLKKIAKIIESMNRRKPSLFLESSEAIRRDLT